MESFGELIKKKRVQKNWTITKLAAELNIDAAALSKIENSKKWLNPSVLPKLAELIDMSFESLKDEYYSEMIATELYKNSFSINILKRIEEKIKFLQVKNSQQGNLDFE